MVPAAETTSPSNSYPDADNLFTFSVVASCPENADFAFAKFEFDSTLVTEWNWVSTVMIVMYVNM